MSRWFGLLEVIEGPFIDSTPIFLPENDPFVVRFRVKELVWLDPERALPIHEPKIWAGLSFTRDLEQQSIAWTGRVRGSLGRLDDEDGRFLERELTAQSAGRTLYPLDEADKRKLKTHTVVRADKVVTVSVPDDAVPTEKEEAPETESRESIRIQALIASIGAQMGMSIWIPRADRGAVLREWNNSENHLLERLPLNYDDTTLRTIEQIDCCGLEAVPLSELSRSNIRHPCIQAFSEWQTF